jgi:hypothetical protein
LGKNLIRIIKIEKYKKDGTYAKFVDEAFDLK